MNQHRSIYKTDYDSYDWMQNNFRSNTDDFCSLENIDDCVQYISQEFCALGYPSIYLSSDSCPSAVNCDIVKLLNVTFDLLGCTKDHVQAKDDLACRNERLYDDLVSLNKKNAELKANVELVEKKYRSALERERQLKEKNGKLNQVVKNEKNEAKKLSSQIQQQKTAYQHEMRKCENNINQLKARLKQIISDKNPEKKVAGVSSSSLLQRNSRERGKWKTGTVAKSSMEEMYNSLISSYENRTLEMLKEISDYQHCFEYLESEIQNIIAAIKDEECNRMSFTNAMPLHVIWSGSNKLKELKERFKCLLCEMKESALKKTNNRLKRLDYLDENETAGLLSVTQELSVRKGIKKPDSAKQDSESQKKLELEKQKLQEKEKELSASATLIEKEKANLENQRLEVIKMAMQQDSAKSEWHRNLKSSSFSVMSTKDGLTAVPSASQLKQCHSAPSQQLKTLSPLWNMTHFESNKELKSGYENMLQPPSEQDTVPSTANKIQDINYPIHDLPKWATSSLDCDIKELGSELVLPETLSYEELDLSNISLAEEQNLDRLKAAFDDLERRHNHPSS